MSERKYTKKQVEAYANYCLQTAINYKPDSLSEKRTFAQLFMESPMFRNSMWYPWIQSNDLKITIEGKTLNVDIDYNVSEDGTTITFKNPI